MRLKVLTTMICAILLLTGCADPIEVPVASDDLGFCDAYTPRTFTQEEIDLRIVVGRRNLVLDYQDRATYDRELCGSNTAGREIVASVQPNKPS
jgi:hypothetical protein